MSTKSIKISHALTWNELADDYDKSHSSRPARTLPLETVFEWAEKQTDRYHISEEGTLHRILRRV